MTVYLIPVGSEKYELYCEQPSPAEHVTSSPATGFSGQLRQKFATVLREVEEQRQRGSVDAPPGAGWFGRLRHRGLAWMAERIAEQRLLWNLRHTDAAIAAYPDDMSFDDAHRRIVAMLQRDHDRHRLWLVVDTLLLLASAVLAIVPGPNVVAYYFAFRVVGHWLSMRGARHGLDETRWSGELCPPLTRLRALSGLDAESRRQCLDVVAAELSLPHLPAFFERVAS